MAARTLARFLLMVSVLATPVSQIAANGCCGKSEDHPHPNNNSNDAAREAQRLRDLERARQRQREAIDQRTRSQDRLRGRVGGTGSRVLSNPSTSGTTGAGDLQSTIQSLGEIIRRQREAEERERAARRSTETPPAGDPPYADPSERTGKPGARTSAVDIDNPPPPPPLKPLFPVWPEQMPETARPPIASPTEAPTPGEMAAKPEGTEDHATSKPDASSENTTETTGTETGQPSESDGTTVVTTLGPDGKPVDPIDAPAPPTGAESGQPTDSAGQTDPTTAGGTASEGATPPSTGEKTEHGVNSAALTPPVTSEAGSAQSSSAPNPDGPAAPESLPTITELPPGPPPTGVVHRTIEGPDGKTIDVFVIDGNAATLDELKERMARDLAKSKSDYNTAWWLNKPAGVATEVVAFGGEVYIGVTWGPLAAAGAVFVKGTSQEAASRAMIEGYAREKDKKDADGNQATFSGPVAGPLGAGLQDAAVNMAFDGMFYAGGKVMGTAGEFLEKPVSEAMQAAKGAIDEIGEQSARGLRHAQETFERSAQAAREAAAPGQRELAEKLARAREIGENLDRMSMQERVKAAAELGAANEGKMTLRQAAARETRALREALANSREAVERQIDDAASRLLDRRNTIMRARAQAIEAAQSKRNWDVGMAITEESVGELAEGEYSPFVQGVMFGDDKKNNPPKAAVR